VFLSHDWEDCGELQCLFQDLKRSICAADGRIVLDFEIAVMIAVDKEFPGVFCGRCFFYMLWNLWRNATQRGMTSLFKKGVVMKMKMSHRASKEVLCPTSPDWLLRLMLTSVPSSSTCVLVPVSRMRLESILMQI
jgi:hypothetical protein